MRDAAVTANGCRLFCLPHWPMGVTAGTADPLYEIKTAVLKYSETMSLHLTSDAEGGTERYMLRRYPQLVCLSFPGDLELFSFTSLFIGRMIWHSLGGSMGHVATFFNGHDCLWAPLCNASELAISPREIRLEIAGTCIEIATEHRAISSVLACFRGKTVLECPDMIHGIIIPNTSKMKTNCCI
jgi:hypothetical protein